MKFNKKNVRKWMDNNAASYTDQINVVNMTELVVAAAQHFGQDDVGGPIDEEDHWIWDVAADVASQARFNQ